MQRIITLALSVSLVVAAVIIALLYTENARLEQEKKELLSEREKFEDERTQFETKYNDLNEKYKKDAAQFEVTEADLREQLADREKTIDEQTSALQQAASFRASIDQIKLQQQSTETNSDWRTAIEEQGKLVEFLTDRLKNTSLTVYRQDPYVVVRIPQATFQSDSAQTSKELLDGLQAVVEVLNSYKGTYLLAVEGHTDNMPLSKYSQYKSNWELGAARSDRVVRDLIHMGVNPADLALVSRSQYMPVHSYDKPTDDETNRRIELVFAPRRTVIRQKSEYVPQTLP
jgi:flagellar motor protein MotB